MATEREYIAELYADIYAVVRKIPRGTVATYGQIAELAGRPGAARVVGRALKLAGGQRRLPWQRVVGKRGPRSARVSILDPIGGATQRQLLESEGVTFSQAGTISLSEHGWLPLD